MFTKKLVIAGSTPSYQENFSSKQNKVANATLSHALSCQCLATLLAARPTVARKVIIKTLNGYILKPC